MRRKTYCRECKQISTTPICSSCLKKTTITAKRNINKERARARARAESRRVRARWVRAGTIFCVSCLRGPLSSSEWHIDHIIPLAEGGSDTEDNLQPLCIPCHTVKSKDFYRKPRATMTPGGGG